MPRMMTARLELRLPEELREAIERRAAERRWSASTYVRVAVEERIARDASAAQVDTSGENGR